MEGEDFEYIGFKEEYLNVLYEIYLQSTISRIIESAFYIQESREEQKEIENRIKKLDYLKKIVGIAKKE